MGLAPTRAENQLRYKKEVVGQRWHLACLRKQTSLALLDISEMCKSDKAAYSIT